MTDLQMDSAKSRPTGDVFSQSTPIFQRSWLGELCTAFSDILAGFKGTIHIRVKEGRDMKEGGRRVQQRRQGRGRGRKGRKGERV